VPVMRALHARVAEAACPPPAPALFAAAGAPAARGAASGGPPSAFRELHVAIGDPACRTSEEQSLAQIFDDLGVAPGARGAGDGAITLRDDAPLASIRRAIGAPVPPVPPVRPARAPVASAEGPR